MYRPGGACRHRLQPHGGLAFEALPQGTEPQTCRDRIEQPPDRRRQPRIDPGPDRAARRLQRGVGKQSVGKIGQPGRVQTDQRVAPGLCLGPVAAQQGGGRQAETAMDVAVAADEHFAAPDRSIRSKAQPVQYNPDGRFPMPASLAQAGRHMGVVVLNFDDAQSFGRCPIVAMARGAEIRM